MSFLPNFSANYLDGKECFYAWVEYGSIAKASKHIPPNPVTKNPPTPRAFWVAAYRWVLDNPDEARKSYVAHGEMLHDYIWEKFLYDKAKEIFLRISSYDRFVKWVNDYGRGVPKLMENDPDNLREMAQNKVIERRNQRKRKEKKRKVASRGTLTGIKKMSDKIISESEKLQGIR